MKKDSILETDFPAAHSMDSTWFAVDEDGHIAVLETDENGYAPSSGDFPRVSAPCDATLMARLLAIRAQTDERLDQLVPRRWEEFETLLFDSDAYLIFEALMQTLGVWTYGFRGWVYARAGVVSKPVHLDDLDPDTRDWLHKAHLPVRFAESLKLAPGEFERVTGWGSFWIDLEGRPHPLAGKEEDFEHFFGEKSPLDGQWYRDQEEDLKDYFQQAEKRGQLPEDKLYEALEEAIRGDYEKSEWFQKFE